MANVFTDIAPATPFDHWVNFLTYYLKQFDAKNPNFPAGKEIKLPCFV